jgi:hypothetical protein
MMRGRMRGDDRWECKIFLGVGFGFGGFCLFGRDTPFFLSVFSLPSSSLGAHAAIDGKMYRCIGMYC